MTAKKKDPKTTGSLTDKARAVRTVKNMLKGDSAKVAAVKAGYSQNYAESKLFATSTWEWIKAEVAKRGKRAMDRAGVHTDQIVGHLVEIMEASPADILPENEHLIRARERGVDHLIKKISITPMKCGVRKRKLKDGTVIEIPVIKEKIDLEMYSRLDAISQLRDNFGMKQEPRVNTYEAQKQMEVEQELDKIMASDGVDRPEAARRLKVALGDESPLMPLVNKYVN